MHSITDTIKRDICIGCGACAVAAGTRDAIVLNEDGMWVADLDMFNEDAISRADIVCPFSDRAMNEDEISLRVHGADLPTHEFLGRFTQTYVGRVSDDEYLQGSSSGGLTSWLLTRLLETGIVDAVLNVGTTPPETSVMFGYHESDTEGARQRRKSQYYSVSLDDALAQVKAKKLKFALVGVPCFIKAARLLATQDPILEERLVFFIGLVCGHMKSHFFGESLAWQLGVPPGDLEAVDFRVKNPERSVSNYDFGAKSRRDDQWHYKRTKDLVGGSWGHGAFQPEACNFCDDIFAETADVAFGDAWLPQFRQEWRGTNIVVSRSERADKLIKDGLTSGAIDVTTTSPDEVAASQAGNFRHRRVGVSVRLADDMSQGLSVPRKRVAPGYTGVDDTRIKIIRKRRALSRLSFTAFREAKDKGNLDIYLDKMGRGIAAYKRIERPLWRRIGTKLKNVLGRLKRTLG